ncbi:unnamed protein product [Aureobasidium mustum]|uniref:EXPERA domain-containing protein n=1 Tax=Aureobasidium mustum TaxID=2773714 RepID=A0A9N8K8I6_9PEZI|nr:unnamed protein product [Aureobasidium mustum]
MPKHHGIESLVFPRSRNFHASAATKVSTPWKWLPVNENKAVFGHELLLYTSAPLRILRILVAEESISMAGNKAADTTYRWVYLFFFNTLWVWIPLWILYQGYGAFTSALNTTTLKQKKR